MASFDEHDKEELDLYVENTFELYERKVAIISKMKRLIEADRYKPSAAVERWVVWLKAGAARYQKEIGPRRFSQALIRSLAEDFAKQYEREIRAGEYDHLG